jgi:hypothetical protein
MVGHEDPKGHFEKDEQGRLYLVIDEKVEVKLDHVEEIKTLEKEKPKKQIKSKKKKFGE